MLHVQCISCAAPYEVDEKRLPASGLKMRCPKCAATFRVHPTGEVQAEAAVPQKKTMVGVGLGGAAGGATVSETPRQAPPAKAPIAPPVPPAAAKPPIAPPLPGAKPPPPPPKSGEIDLPALRTPDSGKGRRAAFDDIDDLPAPRTDAPRPAASTVKRDAVATLDDLDLDLPAPKPAAPQPARPADDLDLDLPMPKGAIVGGKAKGPGFGDLDLPAPKAAPAPAPRGAAGSASGARPGAPSPKAAVTAADDLDLPAPKAARPAPKAPPAKDPSDFSDLDLPAPKAASHGPAFGDLDLPAPKAARGEVDLPVAKAAKPAASKSFDDLDLPAPKAARPAAAKPAAMFGDLDGGEEELDLPAPAHNVDLPAVRSGRASPNGPGGLFDDLDLPAPVDESIDLPAPAHNVDLPAVAHNVDLPAVAHNIDLPAPAHNVDLPAVAGPNLDLPRVSQNQVDLPRAASAADLDLPPPRPRKDPTGVGRVGGALGFGEEVGELELPPLPGAGPSADPPRPGYGSPDELPPLPGEGEAKTADGRRAGARFGEVDLGGEGDGDMEFGDLPQEAPDGTPVARELQRAPEPEVAPAKGKAKTAKPSGPRKPGRTALWVALALLTVVVGSGVALGATEYGVFGVYALERFLPGAGDEATVHRVITDAEEVAADDTHSGVFRALLMLGDARRSAGLNRTLLARSLLHESLYQIRFGQDSRSDLRATAIRARLQERGSDAPGVKLALAADALRRGATADAASLIEAEAAAADPYAFLLKGELALYNNDADQAREAFQRAKELGAGARAQWGLARALLRSGDRAAATAAIEATLAQSPLHEGARVAQAQALWASGQVEQAIQRAREVAGESPVGDARIQASAVDRAEAQTLLGTMHEQRGDRGRAREAYERAVASDPYRAAALLGAGRMLVEEGRYQEGLARLQVLLDSGEDVSEAELAQAKLHTAQAMIGLGRTEEAKAKLLELLGQVPEDDATLRARIEMFLGKAEQALGADAGAETAEGRARFAEAEQHYRRAIALSPVTFASYLALAQMYFETERPADAAAVLTQSRDHVEESAEMRRLLGDSESRRGRLTEAITEYRRALVLDSTDIAAKFGLGTALRRSEQYDEAARMFEEVAQRDPSFSGLALERGLVFEAQGNPDRAVESYEQALATNGDNPDLLLRLGSAQVAAGQTEAAEGTLQRVLEMRPTSAEAEHYLGRVEFARHRIPEALRHFERAIELNAEPAEFHSYLAWAALESGDLTRARTAADRSISIAPTLAVPYWVRGRVLLRAGAVRDAIADLDRSVRLDDSNHAAHAARGDCLDQLGRTAEAAAAYRRALEGDNTQAEWWYRLGRLELDLNHRAETIQALSRATVLGDADRTRPGWLPDAHRSLAEAMAASGERAGAVEHYRRYLEIAPANAHDRQEVQGRLLDLGAAP